MAGALDGVRVVDFGQYVAGPLAAMLLADQGADVVVENFRPEVMAPLFLAARRAEIGLAADLDRLVAAGVIATELRTSERIAP